MYIIASISRTLYTGITGDLKRRIWEHKRGKGSVFAAKYNINRLVHFEKTADVRVALEREKEIKLFRRSRKLELIESENPDWRDLAEGWFDLARPNRRGDP